MPVSNWESPGYAAIRGFMPSFEEGSLQNQARILDAILGASSDFIYVYDREGRLLYAGLPRSLALQMDREDMLGKTLQEMGVSDEYAVLLDAQRATVFATGEPVEGTLHYPTGNDVLEYDYRLSPLRDQDGSLMAVLAVARNVTESRRAGTALREANRRITDILANITDCYYALNRDWRFVEINARAVTFFDRERPEEFLGRSYQEVFPELAGSAIEEAYRRALAEQKPVHFEARSVVVDRWADVHVYPAADGGLHVFFSEITERKRAEEALRESEERYRRILEIAQEGIWILDAEDRTTFANRKMAEMLGYTVEEMLGKPPFDFLYAEEQAMIRARLERRRQGLTEQYDSRYRRKDGSDLWVIVNTTPLLDNAGRYLGAMAMMTDITARKRQEAETRLLYEAGRLLGSTLDLDRIYEGMRTLVSQVMDCDSLLVSAFDSDTKLIRCDYAYVEGERVDVAAFPLVPLGEPGRGMQSTVIHSGEPLLVEDIDVWLQRMDAVYHVDSDGTVREKPVEGKPRSRSALMVPIQLEGQVLGIVQVMSNRMAAYTEEHLRLLEALVLQMAAASRNAYLYKQTQEELAERTRAEQALEQNQAQIEGLNRHLKRAMAETHHRVKNNLQLIASMVDMRLMDNDDRISGDDLRRLGACIGTLATVHDVLTQEAKGDEEAVSLSARAVLERLLPLLRQTAIGCRLVFRIEDARLSTKQGTSLALVANELISNAIKHGQGEIRVAFSVRDEQGLLTVEDDGPGFPEGFDPLAAANTGLEMVQSLSRLDLGGQTRYENRPDGGGRVVLTFPIAPTE